MKAPCETKPILNLCPECKVNWNALAEMLREYGTENYEMAETIIDNCKRCSLEFKKGGK